MYEDPTGRMYQASDGKWYPTSSLSKQQRKDQQAYGQQPPMDPSSQPIYVDQKGGGGEGKNKAAKAGMFGMCCGTVSALGVGSCFY
ncbi:hypothetical protein I302_101410 [Kwoniella bestiolae CBS 10118]|uniref:Uncharacterized protein n=1 Tax=Kwoniella bestiolae CBS 10118 TaxID=1296100 RepID=A0A1B9GC56_9TREE|nr:hypothetical protein I302_00091 [Kwoniella bestiolae CBS 10118]OCF28603.1 hypothetical protein I302_00091 [Kwoniella bestiolae CBS 10118]